MSVALHCAFVSTHRSGVRVPTALFLCWFHVTPAAVSTHCTPYNHAPIDSVTLFEATYVGCMCV